MELNILAAGITMGLSAIGAGVGVENHHIISIIISIVGCWEGGYFKPNISATFGAGAGV